MRPKIAPFFALFIMSSSFRQTETLGVFKDFSIGLGCSTFLQFSVYLDISVPKVKTCRLKHRPQYDFIDQLEPFPSVFEANQPL